MNHGATNLMQTFGVIHATFRGHEKRKKSHLIITCSKQDSISFQETNGTHLLMHRK